MSAASPDWLGVARGAAAELRDVLAAAALDRAARAGDRHARRGRRPDARDRRGGRGTPSSAGSRRCTREGHAFTAISEERGRVDFGGGGTLVVIDPLDGSKNAKRGLPHHALSLAVADGPTMADVVLGFVHDFGPDEEWVAHRGGGAFLDGERLDPGVAERRTRGRLELVGVESADPRWMRDVGRRARRPRAPRAGAGRDGGDALPGRGGAARRDDDAAALPRGRRRGGAADRPRGRRPRRLPGRAVAAGRAARRDGARLRPRRRALARGARGAGRASRASEAGRCGACHPL